MKRILIILILFCSIVNGQWVKNLSYIPSIPIIPTIPYYSDLSLNYSTRIDNLLIDEISNDTAIILNPAMSAKYTGGQIIGNVNRIAEKIFDGQNYTYYLKVSQLQSITTGSENIAYLGGGFTTSRGAYLYTINGTNRIIVSDGIVNYTLNFGSTNSLVFPFDYVEYYIQVNTNIDSVTIDIIANGDSLVYRGGIDISTFTYSSSNNSSAYSNSPINYAISSIKKYNDLVSLERCRDYNDTDSLQYYLPYPHTGIDVSGNGNNFTLSSNAVVAPNKVYVNQNNTYALEKGYVYYKSLFYADTMDYYIPLNLDGSHFEFPNLQATVNKYQECTTFDSAGILNYFDSKIRFSNNYFDKSDTNIWGNWLKRRPYFYYDTNNYKDWHVDELNQKYITRSLNSSTNKLFVKGKSYNYLGYYNGTVEDSLSISPYYRRSLDNILLYQNSKNGEQNNSVLTYTGDIRFRIDGYTDSNYINLGSLQTDTALLVIRFDDAYDNLVNFKAMMDSFNVVGVTNIRVAYASGDSVGHLNWTELKAFEAAGWELHGTGYDDSSLNEESKSKIETDIARTYNEALDSGVTLRHFTPNRYGGLSTYVRKTAMDYFQSSNVGYTIADSQAVNPPKLVLDNMRTLRGDIGASDFLWYEQTGVDNVKLQLDRAVNEKAMVIIYAHDFTPAKSAGLKQIIQYAQSQGVIITTLGDAINNHCSYKP